MVGGSDWVAYFLWGTSLQGSGVAQLAGTGPLGSIPTARGEAQEPPSHPSLPPTGPLEGSGGRRWDLGL